MAESDALNHPAGTVAPPKIIVRTMSTIDTTIMVKQETPNLEANQSPLPTVRLCPPDSCALFASNLHDHLAAGASEQILVEVSALHLVMLASGAGQHADTAVETQVRTPERDYYPNNPGYQYVHVDLPDQRRYKNPTRPPSLWPTRVTVDSLLLIPCSYNYQVCHLRCCQQAFQLCQQKHMFGALSGLFLLSLNLYPQA